jgi:hypothetical protein
MNTRRLFLVLIAGILFAGCARLSRKEAIDIARSTATREGRRLSAYKKPVAHFNVGLDRKYWMVFFNGIEPMSGHHFWVEINDRTEETRLIGGR